ncbi:hypothetical protein N9V31_02580 [Candidatus Poseidonia alphae]|nr:hypothetical protein [Candidatus Poseidonia alphae]
MKPYLRIKEDPGSSMSFLIGDTFREALFKPWKLFFLPLMLYRRIRIRRVAEQLILESNVEILYLIDAESLLDNEFKMFEQILASRRNDLIASVGDFETIMDFSIPSRKSNSDTKQQWNNDLEKFVESIIISRRPKKLIFIGKYPYAGLLGIIRRLESQKFTAWLPIRPHPKTIKERSSRFGQIIDWSFEIDPTIELDLGSVHIDSKVSSESTVEISQWAKEYGLNHSNPHDAGLHIYSESGLGRIKGALERGHLVVYLYETSFDKDFTSQRHVPFFFPIVRTNSGEAEYCVKQILKLYSTNRISLRTSSTIQCEKWNNVIEDAFN